MSERYNNYNLNDADYYTDQDNLYPRNTKTKKLNIEPLVKLCENSASGLTSLMKYIKSKIYKNYQYEEVYDLEIDAYGTGSNNYHNHNQNHNQNQRIYLNSER